MGLTTSELFVACVPLQSPVAVQEVAFVEFQVRVEDWPDVTVAGEALILTVGVAEGGGGAFCGPSVTPALDSFPSHV